MIANQDEDDYIAEGKLRKKQRKRGAFNKISWQMQTLKHDVLFSFLLLFIGLCSCSVHSFSNSRSSSLVRSSSFSHTEPSNMMSPSFSSIQHGYCAGGGDGIHRQSVRVGLFPNGSPYRDRKKRWKARTTRVGQSFKNLMSDIRKKTHSLLLWIRKGSLSALVAAAIFFSNSLSSSVATQEITNFDYVSDVHHKVIDDNGAASIEKYMSVNRGGQKLPNDGNVLQRFVAKSRSAFPVSKKSKSVTPIPMASAIKAKAVKKTISSEGEVQNAITDLSKYMQGPKSDTLLLLLSTALITPLCKQIGTSPILGFLAAGMVIGPNALGLISGIHTTETLAELGIVFFLFEMGIELSYDRLKSMKKDVFGLGLCQFGITAAVIAAVGSLFGIPANALVVLGGGLALSSSAFVLQLLKDNNQRATRFGKASFGVLLFQDLAVVPLLVVTPILAGGGQGLATAVGSAALKATMALGSIAFAGRVILNPLFNLVAQSNSQEAFLGVVLLTVLSMSFITEGLGLSNTLGAFLAGVLLSETKYRYQIEADIAPLRGILLGIFFVTVGFEIDFTLIASNLPLVSSIVAGIILIKSTVLTLVSLAFGLSFATAQQTALLLSQGGEFSFVAFGLARNLGILDPATTKLMLTSVALTMAVTPFLVEAGAKISKKLEEGTDQADRDAN